MTGVQTCALPIYITEGNLNSLNVLDKLLSSTRDYDHNVVTAIKGDSVTKQERMFIIFLFTSNEERMTILKDRLCNKSTIIKKAFNDTSSEMACAKVDIELNSIVDAVNKGSMQKNNALDKVYNLYISNKNNKRICENLASLIPMCVMEYIISDKPGSKKVQRILTQLITNQSYTFKQNNLNIKQIGRAHV